MASHEADPEQVQQFVVASGRQQRLMFGLNGDQNRTKDVMGLFLQAGAGVEFDYANMTVPSAKLVSSAKRMVIMASKLRVVTHNLEIEEGSTPASYICTDAQSALITGGILGITEPVGSVGAWRFDEDLIVTREPQVADNIRGAFVRIALSAATNHPSAHMA